MTTENDCLMYDVMEKMDSMVRVMDEKDTIVFMNEKMRGEFGDFRGKKCYEMMGLSAPCKHCVGEECRKIGKAVRKEEKIDGCFYQVVASPVVLSNDRKDRYAIEIFQDMTDHKRVEQEKQQHYLRLKEDLKFAKNIQRSVLSINDTYWDTLYGASCYQPSEDLGGDLFDIVRLDGDRSLFYMADVSGHGIRSSLLTIFLRQIIRGNRVKDKQLSAILQELITEYHSLHVESDQYFTILIGIYDKKKGIIEFINGGHNCPPILLRKEGSIETVEIVGMPVCSLVKKVNHEIKRISVMKGDRILLYTDGVSEAYSIKQHRAFDLDGIQRTLKNHQGESTEKLVDRVVRDAEEFSQEKNKDDMAVLMIEILQCGA